MDVSLVYRPPPTWASSGCIVPSSPAIHELERRRIFDRCWLYLGHESEMPS